jgi:hypothetical protein
MKRLEYKKEELTKEEKIKMECWKTYRKYMAFSCHIFLALNGIPIITYNKEKGEFTKWIVKEPEKYITDWTNYKKRVV